MMRHHPVRTFIVLFVVLEGLLVAGTWWMLAQVDSGAWTTSTPVEARARIVEMMWLGGIGLAVLLLLLGTVAAIGARNRRD